MGDLKLCVDCGHHQVAKHPRGAIISLDDHLCGATASRSLVTGDPLPLKKCGVQRVMFGGCGPEGRDWQPKAERAAS